MSKVMIVTGGSRGIGAATARMAASAGYDVVVAFASAAPAAEAVADEILAKGQRALVVQCDVAREADVVALFDTVDAQWGMIDVLVNCAGVTGSFGPIEAQDAAATERMLSVNILGTILCAREAVKRMSTATGGSGGAIVNLSSVAARLGASGFATPYAASKGAIDSFTIGLGREVAAHGIRVNSVTPGPTATDMNPEERREAIGQGIPIGRIGEADEIAAAILWLASDAASFAVAANIDVTGGR